jgi:uroporphyrinogen decarboxylase
MLHLMQHAYIERLAGLQPGDYERHPERTYLACQHAIGTCLLDQYIPDNPLTMDESGYKGQERGATTGADRVVCDGMPIRSPEDVVAHLERFAFPRIRADIAAFDEGRQVRHILEQERALQRKLGPGVLKTGYGFARFPLLAYTTYGYTNYFAAYGLYPEVIERHFVLQADLALLHNRAAARAYVEGNLPPLHRLDHDMAGSRGPLVDVRSLDRIWLPHFARCLEPLLRADVRLIWHCDGNLMPMLPRLLEVGIRGFQGFQYEDGMDYARICAMRSRDGEELLIIGGVSVTRTLPFGTPDDVKREIDWLVDRGPSTGLFLGASSSIAPGVPWKNVQTLIEGFQYYRTYRRP